MKRPQSIGELGAFALHRIEIGCREIILIKYKPHMVKRLRSIATVFDGEVEQVERMFASPLNDYGNLRSFAAPNAARTPSK